MFVNGLLTTGVSVTGGSGEDTLVADIGVALPILPTVSGVETLDLEFSAAGTYNAKNTTGVETLRLTPGASNSTVTNLASTATTLVFGDDTAISSAVTHSVTYATGSKSDVTLEVGATPTSGTAAVSVGAVTLDGNTGALSIESVGSKANTIAAVTADKVTSVTVAGVDQNLTVSGALQAKAATTVTVDGSAKNTSVATLTLDESTTAVNVTSDAGTAAVGTAINLLASADTKDINATLELTSGAKSATVGAVAIDANAKKVDVTASVVLTGGAGAITTGTISFLGGADADDKFSGSLDATATDGTVTIGGLTINENAVVQSAAATNINLSAAGGNVTMTTLTVTDSTKTNVTVDAAADDTVTIGSLAGTSKLSTITATGAGTISMFATATSAIDGDTVIDTTGTTGNVTINLASAAAANTITAYLGNAASGKTNVLSTGDGADTIYGGTGADSINGGGGEDTIIGGAGNDTIIGGLAADNLTGGTGADTFVFTSSLTADTITDFTVSQSDVLSFSKAGLTLGGAAGAVTAATAAAVAALVGAGSGDQYVIVDTLANILAFTNIGGEFSSGAVAIATDAGLVIYDANGNFNLGATSIGTVDIAQAALVTSSNLAFVA